MILPERVLGKAGVTWRASGVVKDLIGGQPIETLEQAPEDLICR